MGCKMISLNMIFLNFKKTVTYFFFALNKDNDLSDNHLIILFVLSFFCHKDNALNKKNKSIWKTKKT